jgi:hypothetical protein
MRGSRGIQYAIISSTPLLARGGESSCSTSISQELHAGTIGTHDVASSARTSHEGVEEGHCLRSDLGLLQRLRSSTLSHLFLPYCRTTRSFTPCSSDPFLSREVHPAYSSHRVSYGPLTLELKLTQCLSQIGNSDGFGGGWMRKRVGRSFGQVGRGDRGVGSGVERGYNGGRNDVSLGQADELEVGDGRGELWRSEGEVLR